MAPPPVQQQQTQQPAGQDSGQLASMLAAGKGAPSTKGGLHTMPAGDVFAAIANAGASLKNAAMAQKGGPLCLSSAKISPPRVNALSSKMSSPMQMA